MDVPIVVTLWLLGLFVAAAIGVLMLRERLRELVEQRDRRRARPA